MGCEPYGNDRTDALQSTFKNNKLIFFKTPMWCILQLSRDLPSDLLTLLSDRGTIAVSIGAVGHVILTHPTSPGRGP